MWLYKAWILADGKKPKIIPSTGFIKGSSLIEDPAIDHCIIFIWFFFEGAMLHLFVGSVIGVFLGLKTNETNATTIIQKKKCK